MQPKTKTQCVPPSISLVNAGASLTRTRLNKGSQSHLPTPQQIPTENAQQTSKERKSVDQDCDDRTSVATPQAQIPSSMYSQYLFKFS
jgi:hypothetical protein